MGWATAQSRRSLARLRFSTYTLDDQRIRPLTAQELHANVSGFLDLCPDGYALHHKSKRLTILEFTRAMDSSEDWEEKKDAENDDDVFCLFLQKQKISPKLYTPRVLPTIRGCLEGLALLV